MRLFVHPILVNGLSKLNYSKTEYNGSFDFDRSKIYRSFQKMRQPAVTRELE